MFTIFVRRGDAKTLLDAVETGFQARFLARRWSRTMSFEVVAYEDGVETPCCIYQEGHELFSAGLPPETPPPTSNGAPGRSL